MSFKKSTKDTVPTSQKSSANTHNLRQAEIPGLSNKKSYVNQLEVKSLKAQSKNRSETEFKNDDERKCELMLEGLEEEILFDEQELIREDYKSKHTPNNPKHKESFSIVLDEDFFKNPRKRVYVLAKVIEAKDYRTVETPLADVYPERYLKKLIEVYRTSIRIKNIAKNLSFDFNSEGNDSDRIFEEIASLPVRVELPDYIFDEEELKIIEQRLLYYFSGMPDLKKVAKSTLAFIYKLREMKKNSEKGEIYLKDLSKDDISSKVFLLYGRPGVGKSFCASLLAEILGLPLIKIDAIGSCHLSVIGSSSQWKGSKCGLLASELISVGRMPFVLLIDEIDKSGTSNEHNFIDVINRITDPKELLSDRFLGVELYHLKCAVIIMTANNIEKVEDYIISRANVIKIENINYKELLDKLILNDLCRNVAKIYRKNIEFKYREKLIELLEKYALNYDLDIRQIIKFLEEHVELYFYELAKGRLYIPLDMFLIKVLERKLMSGKNQKKRRVGFIW